MYFVIVSNRFVFYLFLSVCGGVYFCVLCVTEREFESDKPTHVYTILW